LKPRESTTDETQRPDPHRAGPTSCAAVRENRDHDRL